MRPKFRVGQLVDIKPRPGCKAYADDKGQRIVRIDPLVSYYEPTVISTYYYALSPLGLCVPEDDLAEPANQNKR